MHSSSLLSAELQTQLIAFAQSLVRIKSLSGQEGEVIKFIEERMLALGFDEVRIDAMGNLLGRIGTGKTKILFDSHVDTVDVKDAEEWKVPPFSGEIVGGRLHGRGSVDMKSAAAASIYAAVVARAAGFTADKSVFVSCTVFEEDCDGENLKHLFQELHLRPDYVIVCEPSSNVITLGHKGKAQVAIKTHGVSAHGAAPERGVNAIYEMAEIIQRVEKTNLELAQKGSLEGNQAGNLRGTLVMSRITSVSASLNAVPSECEVYLDRRTIPGETPDAIRHEMDQLVAGKKATWAVGTLYRKSWTGLEIKYEPFHEAWKIELEHPLAQACVSAYRENFGREPTAFEFWDFSTNAVTPVSLGIPTIGFGPGEYKLAHMRDESCAVSQILDACSFYAHLIDAL